MKAALLIVSYLLYQVVCINTSRSTVCISHMGACVSPRFCRNEEFFFRQICDFQDGNCQLTDPKVCTSTLQTVMTRSPALRKCLCYGFDPCSTLQQLYSQCQHHLVQENKELETEWQGIGQTGHVCCTNRSCLEEIMACVEEEVCNKKMVPFVQACSTYQCDPSQCRQATGQFYSTIPHNVAEALVFCDCDESDQECQQMKASLHSGICETDKSAKPWTCLEMLNSCSEDKLCRQTFNRYLSDCFGAKKAPYDELSTTDWLQLLDPDFFLGEQHQCRVAFVATMGSVLHHTCICDGLHHHDLHKCNELQYIFQNKSLFKLLGTKENFRHKPFNESSVGQQPTDESDTEQHPAGESSTWQQPTNESSINQLSNQLLYLLIYISVLMVILLFAVGLILHRLRSLHQAAGKHHSFKAHQSKSQMLSFEHI